MKARLWIILPLVFLLMLSGCQREATSRLPDIEPTATYDWMAGESPVPNKRMGLLRAGLTTGLQTVSPQGVYFVAEAASTHDNYILYADHGSDTFIKLCGRSDCRHASEDCNAYVYNGEKLTYYNGYLYVVSGDGGGDYLIRLDPDGSNHTTVLEFQKFAREHNADFAHCTLITDGICVFGLYNWVEVDGNYTEQYLADYMFKLDGSMDEPQKVDIGATVFYSCGDVIYSRTDTSPNSGETGAIWDWDPDLNILTYLTDHPGVPGYFGEKTGYFYMDGAVWRVTNTTQAKEAVINTGLDGNYYVFCFPDCLVVASREGGQDADNNLYIYNWAFELVDTVKISDPNGMGAQHLLIGETAERFILSDTYDGLPLYYINKSELGTENVKIHKFKLPDL